MTGSVSTILMRFMLVPIVAVWIYHLAQRRHVELGWRKRDATLYFTLILLAVWGLTWLVSRFSLQDLYLIPIAFFAVALLVWQRKAIFPYRLRCASCGAPLSAFHVLFYDSNACEACKPIRKGDDP